MTNRMIRLAASLPVLLLLISSFAAAQSTQPDLKGFDGIVEQVMKDWKVPGIAVAIVKDGKIVHAQGYGHRDVKRGLKVTPDTLFAIGSCSKAFTAAALGILVKEDRLSDEQGRRNRSRRCLARAGRERDRLHAQEREQSRSYIEMTI